LKKFTLALGLMALLATMFLSGTDADAQVRYRWRLSFDNDKPERFVYENKLGKRKVYYWVMYTVHNPNPQRVPLMVDVMLHTDSGRDYHQDMIKMDKSYNERGKYNSDVIVPPDVEYDILIEYLKYGNKNRQMAIEQIEKFKKNDDLYLNAREMREKRVLDPGKKVTGIAIFEGVDENSDIIEVSAWGLVDPVRMAKVEETRIFYDYTIEVKRIVYGWPGDEYSRDRDPMMRLKKEWQIAEIGPVSDKETLELLIGNLASNDQALRHGAVHVLRTALDQNFGYDPDKTPEENDRAIKDWREWWSRNKGFLIYDHDLGRYYRQEPKLPGEVEDK
jgi:hypothetical protein